MIQHITKCKRNVDQSKYLICRYDLTHYIPKVSWNAEAFGHMSKQTLTLLQEMIHEHEASCPKKMSDEKAIICLDGGAGNIPKPEVCAAILAQFKAS